MNEIKMFTNRELDLQVRIKMNEDGSISMNAEDTAIGFGWVDTSKSATSGAPLIKVRWSRMNGFCKDLGFSPQVGRGDYIPESLYYLLGMKAGNERALKYQKWLAMDVLPTLRKTGKYEMPKKAARPKHEKLASVNMAAKTLTKTLEAAGVPSTFIAVTVTNLYRDKAGINIDAPILADKNIPKLYDCTEIAKELGIYSKNGLPHKQLVSAIIKTLDVSEQNIVRTAFTKNGHSDVTTQYKPVVLDQVRTYILNRNYPVNIMIDKRLYSAKYQ